MQRIAARTAARLGLAAVMLAGLGCRPPLRRLTEQRQYDQALCAAAHASRDPERDLAYVSRRIDADARPRLHLHAVPRAELVRALGDAGSRLADEAVLVRAVIAIDGVQVDDFGVRVGLVGPQGPVLAEPANVTQLAARTGETIPTTAVEHHAGGRELVPDRFLERPWMGMAAGAFEASTLFVLPITTITGHSRMRSPRTIRTPPTEAEVLAAAPAASAVAGEAARLSHVEHDRGQEISSVWLWPRVEGELELVIEWSYAAYGCAGRKPALLRPSLPHAEVGHTVRLPLPRGGELESRIDAAFGAGMRELGR